MISFLFFLLEIKIVLIFDPPLLKIFITEYRGRVKEKTCDFVFPKKLKEYRNGYKTRTDRRVV